jgi:GNAT superfamily N-acetyltransferase
MGGFTAYRSSTPIDIRPLADGDLVAAQALSLAAGWPHRLDDWRLLFGLGHGIAACDGYGTLLGTAMWWPYGADAAATGMVLVSPTRQGQGIGRHLMQRVLAATGGRRLMLNATEAGLALYEALGFRVVGTVRQHQGDLHAAPSAPPARPLARERHDRAHMLDTAAFGAPRQGLLQRLLDDGNSATVDGAGGIGGFALSRAFGRGQMIGPVIAPDEDSAIAMVASLLQPGFLRIDIPAAATRLAAWLDERGLPCVSTATMMARGDWRMPEAGPRRFALVSQATG